MVLLGVLAIRRRRAAYLVLAAVPAFVLAAIVFGIAILKPLNIQI